MQFEDQIAKAATDVVGLLKTEPSEALMGHTVTEKQSKHKNTEGQFVLGNFINILQISCRTSLFNFFYKLKNFKIYIKNIKILSDVKKRMLKGKDCRKGMLR